jgi:hypothetical protein
MKLKALLADLDRVVRQWPSSDNLIETQYGLPAVAIRRTAFALALLSLAILGCSLSFLWEALQLMLCRRPGRKLRVQTGA